MTSKKCSKCKRIKLPDDFHKGRTECKNCRKIPNNKDIQISKLKEEVAKLNEEIIELKKTNGYLLNNIMIISKRL